MRDLLRKLMFWREDTVELDFEVSGCFTLPEEHDACEDVDSAAPEQTPTD